MVKGEWSKLTKVGKLRLQWLESDLYEQEKEYAKERHEQEKYEEAQQEVKTYYKQFDLLKKEIPKNHDWSKFKKFEKIVKELTDKKIEEEGLTDHDFEEMSYESDLSFYWEDLKDELTRLLKEKNPDGHWHAKVENFGWQNLEGTNTFDADNGEEFLREILPDTDCHFKIYDFGKNGIAINNAHHDSPMWNEWYYIKPQKTEAIVS